MPFTKSEREYLASPHLGRLATVAPNGTLQNNPVGFHYEPATGTIDIGGHNMSASRKFRNVETNPEVAFVVDDLASTDPWRVRGIEIRGRAEALSDRDPATPYLGPEIIRIHPRRILSWGVDPAHPGMHARTVTADIS
jgi:pyridoxamine 5'-phosphate oxidase family protein